MTGSVLVRLRDRQSILMGILNTTPDSFSDGGQFVSLESAVQRAMLMIDEGADIIDIGGESSRPGAVEVLADEEIQRVVPVIEAIRSRSDVCISIDTSKPEVMRAAVMSGADIVNDVNGLRRRGATETCAELDVPVCIMHMQGEPRSMQSKPFYRNVVEDVMDFLKQRADLCIAAGIRTENIIIDPGFGFGKTLQHNMQLLLHLDKFKLLGYPVMVGLSRKSVLGEILNAPVEARLHASVAAAVLGWTKGAKIFRVHDIKATSDALKICSAMHNADQYKAG